MRRLANQRGMTLLEVLIATAVAAVVLTACFGLNGLLHREGAEIRARRDACRLARVFYDRLGRELRGLRLSEGERPALVAGRTALGQDYVQLETRAATDPASAGMARVRYQVQPPERAGGPVALKRAEQSLALAETTLELQPFLEDIRRITWTFHDGIGWHDAWEEGLPRLVRVEIELPAGERSLTFTTTFDLPQGGGS